MMNITDLREKCQFSRKMRDTWYGRNIARRLSIHITVLFVKMGIHAMCATTISMLCGIAACMVFSFGTRIAFLEGALILQLWYVLDHVDGEIARYHGETSLTGLYYDEVTHYVVHPIVFFGIGLGSFRITGNLLFIISAFAAGLGIIILSLMFDLMKLVVLEKTGGAQRSAIHKKRAAEEKSGSFPKKAFSVFHKLCTFPTIMNVITIAAAVDLLLKTTVIPVVLLGYSILLTLVWAMRMGVFIIDRRVDGQEAAYRSCALPDKTKNEKKWE